MNVVIRADASVHVGSGHIIRCLTLADRLRAEGADILFICRSLPGDMVGAVKARGYECGTISPGAQTAVTTGALDAQKTIDEARSRIVGDVDWLIVDHYQLDATWESMLRPYVSKVMAIDDLANRKHDADLLLDQNYESADRYRGLVPSTCRLLLGPRYALLRPEYSAFRKPPQSQRRSVECVLVFFGGSDIQDATGLALDVLSQAEFLHVQVDVVIGANYLHADKLRKNAATRGRTTIYGPRAHLADLMARADLAIGAGGVTNWERMCIGLPSIVIAIADNQLPICEILGAKGEINYIGPLGESTALSLRHALLQEICMDSTLLKKGTEESLCDGLGGGRVIEEMRGIWTGRSGSI